MSVTYHLIHQLLIIPDGRVIKQMTEPVVMFGMHLMDPFFFFLLLLLSPMVQLFWVVPKARGKIVFRSSDWK